MSRIAFVLALADNGVIGDRGRIPWRIPDDMRHFKSLTFGKPCIMGRKTWESLPRKPLPGRINIVVTRDRAFAADSAAVAASVDDALALARRDNPSEICILGGAEIYNLLRGRADRVYLTEVHGDFSGDAKLAPFDRREWRETSRDEHVTPDGLRYSFVTLDRI